MDKDHIRVALKKFELDALADRVIALAAPAIHLTANPTTLADIPLGATRLGGVPDVADGFVWPPDQSFIFQLNLSETAPFDSEHALPNRGWLYFFYEAIDQPAGTYRTEKPTFSVIFQETSNQLHRLEAPKEGLVEPFQVCAIEFQEKWSFPTPESRSINTLTAEFTFDLLQYIYFLIEVQGDPLKVPSHQLLGYPRDDSHDMRETIQLVMNGLEMSAENYESLKSSELGKGVDDWRLLLEVGSDSRLKMWWHDFGNINYWIRKGDLAARKFDSTWLMLEGG